MTGIATPKSQEITSTATIDRTLIAFAVRLMAREHIVVKQPLVQLVRRIRKSESGDKDEWRGRQQRDDDADAAEGETDQPDHDQANALCRRHHNL
jgi:hypothetical protein